MVWCVVVGDGVLDGGCSVVVGGGDGSVVVGDDVLQLVCCSWCVVVGVVIPPSPPIVVFSHGTRCRTFGLAGPLRVLVSRTVWRGPHS